MCSLKYKYANARIIIKYISFHFYNHSHDHRLCIFLFIRELHWLKIRERIIFKYCLLTFNCLKGSAPSYLKKLLTFVSHDRSSRSQTQGLLKVPRVRTKRWGERCFSVMAPRLWNSLPPEVRQSGTLNVFKSKLKSSLFLDSV